MTKIEWVRNADGTQGRTWNPTRGCSVTSPGCTNCYAMRQAHRFSGPGGAYEGLTKLTSSGPQWTGDLRLAPPHILQAPLRWKKPSVVFVNSMSDLFHEALSDDDIAAVFGVMAAAPQHTFQVLTKRAERMRRWFDGLPMAPHMYLAGCADEATKVTTTKEAERIYRAVEDRPWPLPNVWLGVSVEDQRRACERIPHLLRTPAAIRFLSCEPLLDEVRLDALILDREPCKECSWPIEYSALEAHARCECCVEGSEPVAWGPLHWVIVGGESGNGARPMHLSWVRSIVEQCKHVEVPVFVKQLGRLPVVARGEAVREVLTDEAWTQACADHPEEVLLRLRLKSRKGNDLTEWPKDLRVREVPTP